ncbi:cupin domain-containing protein [Streptomyces sp. H27-D2]|uniref:cupin domain-containing protein n=1 Tax=Streptomyces sp. H27-D2 TaxID=3046304 RepID=UPI002DBADAE2|nr:cupin domain-containing protein [Streptomyces sp. H27-D2]MEC4016341.1 cupin domain-containing protein [Streptomyces sp. H27-D2]
MPVVRAADAVVHTLHGAHFTSYAGSASGSRELCAWRLDMPGGVTGVAHRITREEVFWVLAGTFRATVDGHSSDLVTGDVLIAPASSSLRLDTPGESPAAAWVTTGVGLEAVFDDGSRVTPPWAA